MGGLNEPRSKVQKSEDDVEQSRREGLLLLAHENRVKDRVLYEKRFERNKRRGKESDGDQEIWSISNLVFGVAMDGLRLSDKPRCTISQERPPGEGQSPSDASYPCAS
jgi:hypothetical protein